MPSALTLIAHGLSVTATRMASAVVWTCPHSSYRALLLDLLALALALTLTLTLTPLSNIIFSKIWLLLRMSQEIFLSNATQLAVLSREAGQLICDVPIL